MNEKATILYVDDESINLMVFEINFKKQFDIITAISGNEGLEKLKQNPQIKLIVSDMKMPGMDGIHFIKKAKLLYPDKVFFILTGFDISDEISDAINNNYIKKYFHKPFNQKELEQAFLEQIQCLEAIS